MQIGGIQKFSMLDYPGQISAVIFCQGCSLRCPYCHNKEFQEFKNGDVSEEYLLDFLQKRRGALDAIVFSGGEPILQHDLREKITVTKKMGYLIGLHTSGIDNKALQGVLDLVDWVGFDFKTVFEKYDLVSKIENASKKVLESFKLLISSNVNFEVRTTYDGDIVTVKDLQIMANVLKDLGVKKWFLQRCIIRCEEKMDDVAIPLPDSDTIAELSKIVDIELRI
jgi:pyruvate formate lyase activating enzyme